MGRLRTLSIMMLSIGAWGLAAEGAYQEGGPSSAAATRPEAPVPPVEYLRAGAKLFNNGDYDLAAKYLKAAHDYRDQLSESERSLLEQYFGAMKVVKTRAATRDQAIAPAGASTAMPSPSADSGTASATPEGRGYPTDSKSAARWLLVEAREDLAKGEYDAAASKIDRVRGMDIHWGLFDEVTPAKLQKELDKARPAGPASTDAAMAAPTGDPAAVKAEAKARLDEARAALDRGDYDKAQAIAQEVEGWDLNFGLLEDSPSKVIAAAQALRRHDGLRDAPGASNDQSTYDLLVAEARDLMAENKLDEASSKAQHALALNVVPTLDADRAEAVLSDIDRARRGDAMRDPAVQTVGFDVEDQDVGIPDFEANADDPAGSAVVNGSMPTDDPAEVALSQARSMLAGGNFEAARDAIDRAESAGSGDEAQDLLAQINLAEQGAALQLYEAALTAVRGQEYDRARAMLNEVASMPSALESDLAQRVQDLLLKLPSGEEAPKAGLDAQMDAMTVEAQRLNAEVGTKVAESRRLMEVEPDKAIALLEETKAAVEAADLTGPVSRTMVRRLEVAIELAKKDKVAFDAKMADKNARAELEQKKLRILEADSAKKAQIKEMMDKAMAAQNDGDFAAAEAWAERVIAIDPNNIEATAMATVTRVKRRFEEDQQIRDLKEEGNLAAFLDVDRTSIIDENVLRDGIAYPKNFTELTKNRRGYGEVEPYKTPETLQVEKQLEEPISISMPEGTIDEAVTFLRNYTGLNIVLDTVAMQDEALTGQSAVKLTLQDVPIKTVLRMMLQPYDLSYHIEDGVLMITTPQSKGRSVVRVYQVTDLVIAPPRQPQVPSSMLNQPLDDNVNQAGYEPGGDTGGVQITTSEREIDFTPLIQLITTSIAPGTWEIKDPNTGESSSSSGFGLGGGFGGGGGGFGGLGEGEDPPIGSITPFFLNISLIIRHTAEVHDDIVDLLRQLRRLQDLQVSVEVRFITVNDDFFEFIGVDFDFAIQSDLFGPKSSFVTQNPASVPVVPGIGGGGDGATQGGTDTPFLVNPERDHSLGSRLPLTLGVGSPGNIGTQRFTNNLAIPGLNDSYTNARGLTNFRPGSGTTFGLAFLSDLEVYLFLEALQSNNRSNVVQAPKVTTFNGATATIFDQTQRFLVTGLTPTVSAGAIAFQPQISPITDGVTLSVTPVVTADRRYVRLTLAPFFQVITGVDSFSFGSGAVGGGGLGGGAAQLQSTLQLPIVANTSVQTTVTVPDGGTVLLGGVKRLTEQRLESGTPVLSKIPTINRLFRNIGVGRTTNSLMLMVTPRIIILEEEEERLGIPVVPVPGLP